MASVAIFTSDENSIIKLINLVNICHSLIMPHYLIQLGIFILKIAFPLFTSLFSLMLLSRHLIKAKGYSSLINTLPIIVSLA